MKKQLFDRTAIRRQALLEKFTTHARAVNAAAIRRYNEEHGTAIIIRQVKYLRNMSVAAGLEQEAWSVMALLDSLVQASLGVALDRHKGAELATVSPRSPVNLSSKGSHPIDSSHR